MNGQNVSAILPPDGCEWRTYMVVELVVRHFPPIGVFCIVGNDTSYRELLNVRYR
jgi:hypothetical protein